MVIISKMRAVVKARRLARKTVQDDIVSPQLNSLCEKCYVPTMPDTAKKSYPPLAIPVLLIIGTGIVCYFNTFSVPFHFDDNARIIENYRLRSLSSLWPPSDSRWFGFFTFALNYRFGGFDPFGFHLFNLTVHIINSLLVYSLIILTFRTGGDCKSRITSRALRFTNPDSRITYSALFSALLFVCHPVQTQAVTYIVQRFTSLATLLYLLSLVLYVKFRLIQNETDEGPEVGDQGQGSGSMKSGYFSRFTLYGLSLLSAVLAMKTKEIAFTLPSLMTLYEFLFFEGKVTRRILYLFPFLLTLLIIPLGLIGIEKPLGEIVGDISQATRAQSELSRTDYLFTQFRVIVTYLRLLVLPVNQNLDYDYPVFHSFSDPNVFVSFLFLLFLFSLGVFLLYRSRITNYESRFTDYELRLVSFGIFWFFIALSVESSFIPIVDVIFEHRLYLPSVGVFFMTAGCLAIIMPSPHTLMVRIIFSIIVVVLSVATYTRNTVWGSAVSLWSDTAEKSPNKARPQYELGLAYAEAGERDKAYRYLRQARSIDPFFFSKPLSAPGMYLQKGMLDEAIQEYKRLLSIDPNQPGIHNNLGYIYQKKNLLAAAKEEFREAIRLSPNDPVAHSNLGYIYAVTGQMESAVSEYKTAIALDPADPEPRIKLGDAYLLIGKRNDAVRELEAALKVAPGHPGAARALLEARSSEIKR